MTELFAALIFGISRQYYPWAQYGIDLPGSFCRLNIVPLDRDHGTFNRSNTDVMEKINFLVAASKHGLLRWRKDPHSTLAEMALFWSLRFVCMFVYMYKGVCARACACACSCHSWADKRGCIHRCAYRGVDLSETWKLRTNICCQISDSHPLYNRCLSSSCAIIL